MSNQPVDPQIRHGVFKVRDLRLVAHAPPPDDPPLAIGDFCVLNSGGPDCLVVDVDDSDVVFAWVHPDGRPQECRLPRGCVRRRSAKIDTTGRP
jgi:hypothetical protein